MKKTEKKTQKATKSSVTAAKSAAQKLPLAAAKPVEVKPPEPVVEAKPQVNADAAPASPKAEVKVEPTKKKAPPVKRKEGITYIEAAKMLAILKASGLRTEEKAAFTKVTSTTSKAKVYVPRRSTVSRVDVANFEPPAGTCIALGDRSFGKITHQLDFSKDEATVLKNFELLLATMAAITEPAKKEPKIITATADEANARS